MAKDILNLQFFILVMIISFFEEYPNTKNLRKLKLVKWPTKLYIAAKSAAEFQKITSKIRNKNVKEIVYWPVLDKQEGYWISPFSKTNALKRIFLELEGEKIPVMLDLELPTTQNPLLYLTQSFNFYRNKALIGDFIRNYEGKLYLAEYYPQGKIPELWLSWLGLHYVYPTTQVIKMMYHSMHYFKEEFVRAEFQRGVQELGNRFVVGLGTIAVGVMGNEPILSLKQLQQDLQLAKNAGVKEVIIFRLGGLDVEYAATIESLH